MMFFWAADDMEDAVGNQENIAISPSGVNLDLVLEKLTTISCKFTAELIQAVSPSFSLNSVCSIFTATISPRKSGSKRAV